jgi:hypothetical protein
MSSARIIHLVPDAQGLTWAEIEEQVRPGDVIGMYVDITTGVAAIDKRAWDSATRGNFEEARLIQAASTAGLIEAGGGLMQAKQGTRMPDPKPATTMSQV